MSADYLRLSITDKVINALINNNIELPIGYNAYRHNSHNSVVILLQVDVQEGEHPYFRRYSPIHPNVTEEHALIAISLLAVGIPYDIVLQETPHTRLLR